MSGQKEAIFIELLKQFIDKEDAVIVAEIKTVDKDTELCTVDFNGATIEGVRLRAFEKKGTGFLMIPKIGSPVILSRFGTSSTWFMLQAQYVDEIYLTNEKCKIQFETENITLDNGKAKIEMKGDEISINGGNYNGLVKIDTLKDNISSLKSYVEAMNTAIPAAFTAVGASTAASGSNGKLSYDAAMQSKIIQIIDMENPKVKH